MLVERYILTLVHLQTFCCFRMSSPYLGTMAVIKPQTGKCHNYLVYLVLYCLKYCNQLTICDPLKYLCLRTSNLKENAFWVKIIILMEFACVHYKVYVSGTFYGTHNPAQQGDTYVISGPYNKWVWHVCSMVLPSRLTLSLLGFTLKWYHHADDTPSHICTPSSPFSCKAWLAKLGLDWSLAEMGLQQISWAMDR